MIVDVFERELKENNIDNNFSSEEIINFVEVIKNNDFNTDTVEKELKTTDKVELYFVKKALSITTENYYFYEYIEYVVNKNENKLNTFCCVDASLYLTLIKSFVNGVDYYSYQEKIDFANNLCYAMTHRRLLYNC